MEPLFGLIAAAIAASVAYLVTSERRRAQLRVWRARGGAGRAHGGRGSRRGGSSRGRSCAVRSGDLRVRLEGYRRGKYERGTKIVVTGLGHGAGGLSLRREGLGTAIEKRFIGEREIEIGDPSFDDEYYVQGQAPLALAILEPGTRRRLAGLLRGQVAVEGREPVDVDATLADGVLEVRVKESGFSGSREHVPAILPEALDVARLLVAPKDVAARIAGQRGPRARDRRAAAGRADARPGVPAAPGDARDAPRRARGRERGGAPARGDGPRRGGAGDAARPRRPAPGPTTRARRGRSRRSGEQLPRRLAEATLRRALGGAGRPLTAQACLEALGRLGRPEAEGLLLEALRSEDPPVSVAAAQALGRAGTVTAVVPLREAAERGGDLRRAARQAIAGIQARLAGAEPGQLSLAGGEAGALSLADGEPGRLSLRGRARLATPDVDVEPEVAAPGRERPRERE